MSTDEEAALRTLRTYRQVIDALIGKHNGRIFNTAGDAVLAEFGRYKPIPFNAALPEETVSYLAGDSPLSEASPWYRRGAALPFVAISREQYNLIDRTTAQTLDCANGKCRAKA
jgi:class 3 adenylate cyclase